MLLNVLQIQLDQDSLLDHDLRCFLVLGRNQNYIHIIIITTILMMVIYHTWCIRMEEYVLQNPTCLREQILWSTRNM